eukprot:TRINITY_DN20551_c0_g1_i1.p1 TRINITY_DN20551_c0_g1~~TRINITY_DN20551_c0_g1_i1.p1  ORF type:complete len:182 (-),score=27.50 TRINITY_DN20551_c0_g1_i1:166-711(-)
MVIVLGINVVYTPPEERRKGYAASLVEAVSRYFFLHEEQPVSFVYVMQDSLIPSTSYDFLMKSGFRLEPYFAICDFKEIEKVKPLPEPPKKRLPVLPGALPQENPEVEFTADVAVEILPRKSEYLQQELISIEVEQIPVEATVEVPEKLFRHLPKRPNHYPNFLQRRQLKQRQMVRLNPGQ